MNGRGKWLKALGLLACVLAPSVAEAQEETETGDETAPGTEPRAEQAVKADLGLRTGYAIPFGKMAGGGSDDKMNDFIAGQIPLWADLGARIHDRIFVGVYVSYGFGILSGKLSDACDDVDAMSSADISCSTSDVRLGAQVHYHFGPSTEGHFWLGGGLGYEWWHFSETASLGSAEATATLTAHGFEFVNLQLGGDFPVAKNFTLGPFAAFSLAQFGRASADCSGDCEGLTGDSESIDEKALHQWLFLGVRGSVQFAGN